MKLTNTIADLAWLAGILDADGSIFITKQQRKDRERTFNYLLRISVQSTDTVMARTCFELTESGEFYYSKTSKPNQSNTFKWQVNGRNALKVLKELVPFMKVKKDQAQLAITFQETTKKHWRNMLPEDYCNQEEFYYRLKQIKIDNKIGKDTVEYQSANKIFQTDSDIRTESTL